MVITASDPFFKNTWEHISLFLSGATALGIIAHAVDTFPLPKSPYGQWILGTIKYIVGQRASAANAKQGLDSVVVPIMKDS